MSQTFHGAFTKSQQAVWRRKKPRPNGAMPRWLDWPRWLTFGLIFLLFFAVAATRIDPDFGWHLREGRELSAGVYDGGHYTFTADDYDYATHEWLSDIILAGLYDAGGYYLLALVYATLFTLAFWLMGRRKLGLVVFAAFLATLPFIGVRTVVYSCLGLALVMFLTNLRQKKWRWILPLIIWLWAQLHGSFLIGIAYLIFRAIFVDKNWRLAGLAVAGGALALINPFGVDLYRETLVVMGDSSLKHTIKEWQIGVADFWLLTPIFLLWLSSFFQIKIKKPRDLWQLVRFDTLLCLASLGAIRQWPLFALTAIDAADQSVRCLAHQIVWRKLKRGGKIFVASLGVVLLGSLAALTVHHFAPLVGRLGDLEKVESEDYPHRSVDYLRVNGCAGGNLFNYYDWGGYLDWRLPEVKTYIDGRMPSWWRPNGEKYMETYTQTLHQADRRAQEFARWGVSCALIPQNDESDIYKELNAPESGWDKVVSDDGGNAALFIKR